MSSSPTFVIHFLLFINVSIALDNCTSTKYIEKAMNRIIGHISRFDCIGRTLIIMLIVAQVLLEHWMHQHQDLLLLCIMA